MHKYWRPILRIQRFILPKTARFPQETWCGNFCAMMLCLIIFWKSGALERKVKLNKRNTAKFWQQGDKFLFDAFQAKAEQSMLRCCWFWHPHWKLQIGFSIWLDGRCLLDSVTHWFSVGCEERRERDRIVSVWNPQAIIVNNIRMLNDTKLYQVKSWDRGTLFI